jgi:hypothetical protein
MTAASPDAKPPPRRDRKRATWIDRAAVALVLSLPTAGC